MEKRISPFLTGGFSPNRMQSKWVYPFRPFTPSILPMCYRGRMWRGGHPSPPLESGGNSCTSSELNPLVSNRLPRRLFGINKKARVGQTNPFISNRLPRRLLRSAPRKDDARTEGRGLKIAAKPQSSTPLFIGNTVIARIFSEARRKMTRQPLLFKHKTAPSLVAKPSVRIRSLLKIGCAATAIRTNLAGRTVETLHATSQLKATPQLHATSQLKATPQLHTTPGFKRQI